MSAFERLHHDVKSVRFADFPDYSNVGDSAIALGQTEFWRRSGIELSSVYTAYSFPDSAYSPESAVFINGGGSLGGLYGFHNEHRYALAERLNPSAMLIQGPQSVHFPSSGDQDSFLSRMATRPKLRIAVRDEDSRKLLNDACDVILSPDAAHLLGSINCPEPTVKTLVLARRDKESAAREAVPPGSVDWVGADTWWMQKTRTAHEQAHRIPGGRWLTRPAPKHWIRRAEQRLARGVRLLAPAETLVTDRLHGMLMALQMGKRVIAVDNNNNKLSAYAETWFGDSQPDVRFARDFDEAAALA